MLNLKQYMKNMKSITFYSDFNDSVILKISFKNYIYLKR